MLSVNQTSSLSQQSTIMTKPGTHVTLKKVDGRWKMGHPFIVADRHSQNFGFYLRDFFEWPISLSWLPCILHGKVQAGDNF